MIEIRDASPADVDAIVDVQVSSWRAAYRPFFPASYLDSDEFVASRRAGWQQWAAREPGATMVAVAEADGRVVGFGLGGPERPGTAADAALPAITAGELYAFYLHPDAWGSGAATPLMERCVERLGEMGFTECCLWVLLENARARRFYERVGWTPTGWTTEWSPDDATDLTVVEERFERPSASALRMG